MRNRVDTGWTYSFPHATCQACPLQAQCLAKLPRTSGRMVVMNDYAAEYAAARQQAQTPVFRQVRREHPAIERKLAEIVRQHDGRRARYRGRPRTRIQYLLTASSSTSNAWSACCAAHHLPGDRRRYAMPSLRKHRPCACGEPPLRGQRIRNALERHVSYRSSP